MGRERTLLWKQGQASTRHRHALRLRQVRPEAVADASGRVGGARVASTYRRGRLQPQGIPALGH